MGKPAPLVHTEGTGVDHDAVLASEQEAYLQANPSIQFVVSCIELIRKYEPSWLAPSQLRERYPSKRRMEWLKHRPDLRQAITMANCGLGKNSARVLGLEKQAELLDTAVDERDISITQYELGFRAQDLACYGDTADLYVFMVESLPWGHDVDQEFVGHLIKEVLEPRGTHPSILTHFQVRRAINGLTWQDRLPDEILAKIDEDRHDQEELEPTKPFTAQDEFKRATPQIIAKYLPLISLKPIFLKAMEVMGFTPEPIKAEPVVTSSSDATESPVGTPTMHAPPTTEHEHSKPTALLPSSLEDAAAPSETKTENADASGEASIESNELDASEIAELIPASDVPPAPPQEPEAPKASEADKDSEVDKSIAAGVAELAAMEVKDAKTTSDPPSSSHKPEGSMSRRDREREKKKAASPPPLPTPKPDEP